MIHVFMDKMHSGLVIIDKCTETLHIRILSSHRLPRLALLFAGGVITVTCDKNNKVEIEV